MSFSHDVGKPAVKRPVPYVQPLRCTSLLSGLHRRSSRDTCYINVALARIVQYCIVRSIWDVLLRPGAT